MADPFREPAPPEEKVSEADEMIRRAQAKRGKKWPFLVVVAGLFSLPFLYIGYAHYAKHRAEHRDDLEGSDVAEAEKLAAKAEQVIAAKEAAYAAAVTREKLAGIQPGDGVCGHGLPTWIALVRPGEPLRNGDRLTDARRSLAEVREKITAGTTRKIDLEIVRDLASGDTFKGAADGVLIAEQIVDAQIAPDPVTHERHFAAGRITGRGYVYSHEDARVVCAGDVDARNSPTVEVTWQSTSLASPIDDVTRRLGAEQEKLREDLRKQMDVAFRASMHAVAR